MALVGGILSIIQPELYELGLRAFDQLVDDPTLVATPADDLLNVLQQWAAPFNAVSIISNRETPIHHDVGSRPAWSDLLLALGEYEDGRLELPTLGIVYQYNAGTMVAFSGCAFSHGAKCVGNRACIAWYMRDNVMKRLGLPLCGWADVNSVAPPRYDEYEAQENSWMFYDLVT